MWQILCGFHIYAPCDFIIFMLVGRQMGQLQIGMFSVWKEQTALTTKQWTAPCVQNTGNQYWNKEVYLMKQEKGTYIIKWWGGIEILSQSNILTKYSIWKNLNIGGSRPTRSILMTGTNGGKQMGFFAGQQMIADGLMQISPAIKAAYHTNQRYILTFS